MFLKSQANEAPRLAQQEPPEEIAGAMLIGGDWVRSDNLMQVLDVDTGAAVGTVPVASEHHVRRALDSAVQGQAAVRALASYRRAGVLSTAAAKVLSQRERFARTIAREGIKTIREARAEVDRCARTLSLCADLACAPSGESLRLDTRPGTEGRHGHWISLPAGIVVAITPFNDPLNLVAHKIGPAIAVGAPVILKPHEQTPLSAVLLVEVLLDSGMHPLQVQLLTGFGQQIGPQLTSANEVRIVSFTGGRRVGESIAKHCSNKILLFELGGPCSTIVMPDADLKRAAAAIVSGATWAAGQNCLHVQRVLVHDHVHNQLRDLVLEGTSKIQLGPKLDAATDMGPLISRAAVDRTADFIEDATLGGANILLGGSCTAAGFQPTWLDRVTTSMKIASEEVFAPVSTIERFRSLEEAMSLACNSGPSLQAGIFTDSLSAVSRAIDLLPVGAVVVNDSSDFRDDAMPFGGPGAAGIGREGVRFAASVYSEPKLVCYA